MRIAVIALRNAADARMNTSSVMRLSHSSLSRSVMGGIVGTLHFTNKLAESFCQAPRPHSQGTSPLSLVKGRRRIVWQFVLARVRALHFQLVEKQRRADDRGWHAAQPVAH